MDIKKSMDVSRKEDNTQFLSYLRDVEKKWQKAWSDAKVFEAELDNKKQKYFITVPYPYPTGPLHIGHGRSYTVGDVHARYERMQGKNVLFPMAFHITGSPIESISNRLKEGDVEFTNLYKSYVSIYLSDQEKIDNTLKSFANPIEVANFFASNICRDFDALGLSIDWRHKFTTGDALYNSFVSWQFRKLKEKGYITTGSYPILYAVKEKQAVGEDDIAGGDELAIEIKEHAAFEAHVSKDIDLLCTCPADIASGEPIKITINPEATYVIASFNQKKLITSEQSVEKLANQGKNLKVTERLLGKEILKRFPTASCAQYNELKLADGQVNSDVASGVMLETTPAKSKDLQNEKNAALIPDFLFYDIAAEKLPVKTRAGSKVIVAVVDGQWFIDYSIKEWKSVAREALSETKVTPERYRKQFNDAFDWLAKRPCARERGIGTRLPFDPKWIIEPLSDSTAYMAFYVVSHKLKTAGAHPEKLVDQFWDYVFLGRGSLKNVETLTGLESKTIESMRTDFLYWYPVDERHTAVAHINNHLSFFIFTHAALFPKELWPKSIALNNLVIRDGTKMSKSKGNVIPLFDISEKYSSDLFRLFIISAGELDSVLDWNAAGIDNMASRLQRFKDVFEQANSFHNEGTLDKKDALLAEWFASTIEMNIQTAKVLYDSYKYRDAIQKALFDNLNCIETYLKYSKEKDRAVVNNALEKIVLGISPVVPHLAEELWRNTGREGFISLMRWPEESAYNKLLIEGFEAVNRSIEDINKITKIMKGSIAKKVTIIIADDWKYELVARLNMQKPKSIGEALSTNANIIGEHKEEASEIVKIFTRIGGETHVPERNIEKLMTSALVELIKDHTNMNEVIVLDAVETNSDKKFKALPGKPAIIISE